MAPKWKYSCSKHDEWDHHGQSTVINIATGKKFKHIVIAYMRENNLLTKRGNMLCTGCYEQCLLVVISQEQQDVKRLKLENQSEVDYIVKLIREGKLRT